MGQYNLFIRATEDCGVAQSDPPHVSVDFKFSVFIFQDCDPLFTIEREKLPEVIEYAITATAWLKETKVTDYHFIASSNNCSEYTAKYSLRYADGAALPTWITPANPSEGDKIKISTNDSTLAGTKHKFTLKCWNAHSKGPMVVAEQTFTVIFPANFATSITCSTSCPPTDVTYYLG